MQEEIWCIRLGGSSTCRSMVCVLSLWGRIDYGVFGKVFKSLSIFAICMSKRFESIRISMFVREVSIKDAGFVRGSILVDVDFWIEDLTTAVEGSLSVGVDSIGRGGRGGPRVVLGLGLAMLVTTCG